MKRFQYKEFFFYLILTTVVFLILMQISSQFIYFTSLFLIGFCWRAFVDSKSLMLRASSKDVRFSFIRLVYLVNFFVLKLFKGWLQKLILIFSPVMLLVLINKIFASSLPVEFCLFGSLYYEIFQWVKMKKHLHSPQKNGIIESE